ncbi:MAG: hypothetical protein A2X80_10260 [Geobacteraceae bacterium GWB2_52_12]|nr:MAG: hypothetical protein A2X80_10260 [Geobacteraceae bacterium GWB2_52_12]
MKQLNNKGVALLTALMMTVIMLSIILGVMYLINQSIKGSAARKTYNNVVEASYGGADLVAREIIPQLFDDVAVSRDTVETSLELIEAKLSESPCLQNKLEKSPSDWGSAELCESDISPRINPDVTFELKGLDDQNFTVYSKIVDTEPGVPYTDGNQLVGGGVAESSAGSTLKLDHYVYRIEVSAERKARPAEKSNISVLYEY